MGIRSLHGEAYFRVLNTQYAITVLSIELSVSKGTKLPKIFSIVGKWSTDDAENRVDSSRDTCFFFVSILSRYSRSISGTDRCEVYPRSMVSILEPEKSIFQAYLGLRAAFRELVVASRFVDRSRPNSKLSTAKLRGIERKKNRSDIWSGGRDIN